MFRVCAVLLVALVAFASASGPVLSSDNRPSVSVQTTQCSAAPVITVDRVLISNIGNIVTVFFDGQAKETVNSGDLRVTVYNGENAVVYQTVLDLCKNIQGGCPVAAGPVHFRADFKLAKAAGLKFAVNSLSITGDVAQELLCVEFTSDAWVAAPSSDLVEVDGGNYGFWGECGLCQDICTAWFAAGKFAACDGASIISDFCEVAADVCDAVLEAACEVSKHYQCSSSCSADDLCHRIGACGSGPKHSCCKG